MTGDTILGMTTQLVFAQVHVSAPYMQSMLKADQAETKCRQEHHTTTPSAALHAEMQQETQEKLWTSNKLPGSASAITR